MKKKICFEERKNIELIEFKLREKIKSEVKL